MKELLVEAKKESLRAVSAFAEAELEAVDCPVDIRRELSIAIDELFGNIAQYAYEAGTGPVSVRFDLEQETRTVVFTFQDGGTPFDPLAMDEPDTTLKARERKIGGLGIFLVKKMMDEVRYAYRDGKNVLTIRKKI